MIGGAPPSPEEKAIPQPVGPSRPRPPRHDPGAGTSTPPRSRSTGAKGARPTTGDGELEARFRRARDRGLTSAPTRRGAGDDAPTGGYHWLTVRAAERSPFKARQTYELGGATLTGAALEAMRQDWLLLVLKRKLTANGFCRRHKIKRAVLNALKRTYPDDFTWRARRPVKTFAPAVVEEARTLIERYHAEELTYLALKHELRALGVEDWQHENLERQLPNGMRIARRQTSVYQQRRLDYFTALADDLEAVIARHGWVIGKQTDLLEVLSRDEEFKAKYPPKTRSGEFNLSWLGKLRAQDLKEGSGRIAAIADRVKPEGKRGRRQPTGDPRRTDAPAAQRTVDDQSSRESLKVRDQLRHLAERLAAQEPSEAALKRAVSEVNRELGLKRTYRIWRLLMEKHKGVIPELARWRVGSKNDYSLQYLARWVVCTHQAGPAASEADVAALFTKTPEYQQDGRLPDTKLFSQVKRNTPLGWDIAVVTRGRFQLLRNLLEAIRTAPADRDLKHILAETQIRPQFDDYEKACYYLNDALKGGEWAAGLDTRVLVAIRDRPTRFIGGLGQKPDPAFDVNAEPPWFPLRMAEKLLSVPRVEDSPLFAHAIERLDGRLPFENNHMMVVYHRYADILPLMDLFIRAGMSPKNSVYVSTPYPFDPAFDLQLRDWGIPQIPFPVYDEKAFSAAVAEGLQRMIDLYDERERKHGYGRPILVLDDGGHAANQIRGQFKAHAHKFKVVEVTAAGHRITAELKAQHRRVPFIYYSIAYSDFKRQVTSSFYAHRVVDRIRAFSAASGVEPINNKVAVIGGGPMGAFAARYYKTLGCEVVVVDRDAKVRAELRQSGFAADEVVPDTALDAAIAGRGVVLSMCGYKNVLGPAQLDALADGAILAQGSSKRNDFDMAAFEKRAKRKTEIPRRDELPQKSFTYELGGKRLHFCGDGWTINHDGSLHGSPFEDVQLETVLLFESAVEAASDSAAATGDIKVVGDEVQEEYVALWKKARRARQRRR